MNRLTYLLINFILFICFFINNSDILAQPQPLERNYKRHNQLWSALVLENHLGSKLRGEFDIQYRRQNIEEGSLNIIRAYQYQSYRLWLHYDLSDHLTFSLSPILIAHELPLADDGWQFYREPQEEYRVSFAVWKRNKPGKVKMNHRYSFEYRHRTSYQDPEVFWPEWRLHYYIKFTTEIINNIDLALQNEIFIAFGQYIQHNIFDQNRIYLGIEPQISDLLRLQFGYSLYFEQLRSGVDFNVVNILNIGVSIKDIINRKN